mmetsp:Transcript_20338/g.50594  ORF Transcript_20338/g.50594 Transcript_20338/m.50594 type:complete len:259 (+) Transcript_20338:473-1249(+)
MHALTQKLLHHHDVSFPGFFLLVDVHAVHSEQRLVTLVVGKRHGGAQVVKKARELGLHGMDRVAHLRQLPPHAQYPVLIPPALHPRTLDLCHLPRHRCVIDDDLRPETPHLLDDWLALFLQLVVLVCHDLPHKFQLVCLRLSLDQLRVLGRHEVTTLAHLALQGVVGYLQLVHYVVSLRHRHHLIVFGLPLRVHQLLGHFDFLVQQLALAHHAVAELVKIVLCLVEGGGDVVYVVQILLLGLPEYRLHSLGGGGGVRL